MQRVDAAAEWDEQTFARALERLRTDGTIDASGMNISAEQLARILEAAPEDPDRSGRPLFKWARFLHATFDGIAGFKDATFEGPAEFMDATFEGPAVFMNATFKTTAQFDDATFEDVAMFDRAIFEGDAFFKGATFMGPVTVEQNGGFQNTIFKGDARFRAATFNRGALFAAATFDAEAEFFNATFMGDARFSGVTFNRSADFFRASFEDGTVEGETLASYATFGDATFAGLAGFSGVHFKGSASFSGATFERNRDVGPVRTDEDLTFSDAVFDEPVRIVASASMLACSRARFRRGAEILVRRALIVLDEADFAEPSVLAPWIAAARGEASGWREGWDSEDEPAARLVSLRRTKVANLTITGVDLRACRFDGAHGLDRLRLERVRFAETPSGWQPSSRWGVPIRWTRRLTIAEEHQWRAEQAGAIGWYGPEVRMPSKLEAGPQTSDQIAAIYRALRKGREDTKDEPGAADFYYGEMEMRRQRPLSQASESPADGDRATATRQGGTPPAGGLAGDAWSRDAPRAERLILWLYWLVSGYGLRASRALIALALTAVVFAFFFDVWGFQPDRGFERALLFSVESTSSLFRAPETEGFALSGAGEVLQIVLRLLGPLFFGLALLSLRGRVKR